MPDLVTASDPFTLLHMALWDALGQADTSGNIRPGNRIDLNTSANSRYNRSPKEVVAAGDLPELMLWLQSVEQTGGDSGGREYRLNYVWLGSTGTYTVGVIYPTVWLLSRVAEILDTTKGLYQLDGYSIIVGVTTPNGVITDIDANLNRGLKGFSTLWTTQVDLYIPNTSILLSE